MAILVGMGSAWQAERWFSRRDQSHEMLTFYESMLRLNPVNAPIAAYLPMHPVVRRDVFYGWSRTLDPGGFGTEAIMRALDVQGYSRRFEPAYYRQELASRPPALVVAPLEGEPAYEPAQWAALRAFLQEHQAQYTLMSEGLLRPVWVRQDRIAPPALPLNPGPGQ